MEGFIFLTQPPAQKNCQLEDLHSIGMTRVELVG
jgi:hypothetical protein